MGCAPQTHEICTIGMCGKCHVGICCVTLGHVGGEIPEFAICVIMSDVIEKIMKLVLLQCVRLMSPNFLDSLSVSSNVAGTPVMKQNPNVSWNGTVRQG